MKRHSIATALGRLRPAAMLVAFLAMSPAGVQADIYKCTDGEGLVTFTDSPSRKFKECVLLYRDPAARAAPAAGPAGQAAPAAQPSRSGAAARGKGEAPAVRANPGPDNFPRVDQAQQRDRDLKARQIVEQELASEQRLLEEARKQVATLNAAATDKSDPRLRAWQETASRHARNIIEIQRQLSLMK